MKIDAKTVDEYFEKAPPELQEELGRLQRMVNDNAPGIEEKFEYGMPCYEIDGSLLFSIASQKQYMAFYVMDKGVVDAHRAEMSALDIGKGCIRFKKPGDLPAAVVKKIVKESVQRLRRGESELC